MKTDNRIPVHRCALKAATVFFATAFGILAAPIKVDINNSGRAVSEGNDPAYTPWSDQQTWFAGGNTTSATFSGVTVKFTRVGSVGSALQSGYWKTGVQSTTYNAKLTADGLKVENGDAGAQIEMRITGLSAGAHTLLLWLSNWDAATSNAPLDISVGGTQVVNNLAVSTQVTNNNNASTAYLNITAVSGQDVVVLVKADTASGTVKNVHINGFEIDTPNTKAQANNPVPANADEHVDSDSGSETLSWTTAVLGAASHNVYFGTSESAVTNATTASAEYKGNRTTNSYAVSGINPHLTYYWRVDEVASGGTITKGSTWYFRPRRLAFPGAEGYGRFARGGRGGVVVHVTNLNDSGAGSLRDALLGNYGPRTVVFDVSGLITLGDDVIIDNNSPYITVAGQTAPGKGICVRQQQLAMSGARDVIFRYMRLFVGKDSGETQNATGMAGVDHCIMDHVSAGWGIDEGLSSRGAKNLTFQRSMIAEMLNAAGHQNYPAGDEHGFAASIGGDKGSFHHNLLAHNMGRNWSLAGGLDPDGFFAGRLDITNNVVYNWGSRTTDGGAHEVNFVNNYYKPTSNAQTFYALTAQHDNFPGTQQYYFAGNVMPGHFNESNQTAGRNGAFPNNDPYQTFVNAPFFASYVATQTATNGYKSVLSDVGCNLPQIDNHDTRVIGETLNGTTTYTGSVTGKKGLPDKTSDVGGWENYGTTARAANWDTDKDGMPDWFETLKGFSNSSPAGNFTESNSDADGDGYTALEEYLNFMGSPHFDCTAGSSVDVDLAVLSRGYSNTSPTYTVSSPTNGTVAIVSSNKGRFTPSTSANALGKFTYTVTDSAGDSMTRTINIRIIGGAVTIPAAPTSFSATAGNGQVSLTWTASSGATSYNVKRATTSGGPYTTVASAAVNSYVNTGLTNGTAYYYVVSAVNSAGESANSGQASATPQLAVSATPTGFSATAGNAQVSLAWSASSGAGSYNVKRAATSGGPYTIIASPTTTSYVDAGLSNGTVYYYVVSAVNTAGESANSAQASATPSPSTTLQVEAGTIGGGVTIDSDNIGFNGAGFLNFPTTGGFVQLNNVNGGTGGAATMLVRYALGVTTARTGALLVNGVSQPITFAPTGGWATWVTISVNITLNSGTANTIRFESNGSDFGNIDEITVTPSTGPTAPAAPTGLSATAGDGQATLSWSASSGATSYNVKRATTSGGPYTTVSSPIGTSYNDTGLNNGTTYYYVLSAVNAVGESGNSSQASATPQPPAPSAPTGLAATAGNAQVSLSWTASPGATSYNVKRSTTSGSGYTTVGTATDTSFTNTGLTNGTTYYYVVSAINGGGESANSTQANATPQPPAPSAPTGLGATAGNAQVSLSWTASSGATSYNVKRATVSGGPYTTVSSATGTSYTSTGLTNGTTYYYVVSAVNGGGESANSGESAATPQPPVPAAPTGLTAVAGNAQVSLNWTASSGATSYNVKRGTTPGGPYITVVSPSGTSHIDTGLTNDTAYYYVISAVNVSGESVNSGQASATPAVSGLLVYEGFGYTSGASIANQAGGTGWGANWSSTGNPQDVSTAQASSLSSGTLQTSGGSVTFGPSSAGGSTSSGVYMRQFSNTLGNLAATSGGAVWLSALYLNTTSSVDASGYYGEARIGLYSGVTAVGGVTQTAGATQVVSTGTPATSATVLDRISLYNGATVNATGVATPRGTTPALLLMKVVADNTAATDTVYLWVNPNLALGEPAIATANASWTTSDLSGVNGLRFQQAGTNGGVVTNVDEIRLGKAFVDAAPSTNVPSPWQTADIGSVSVSGSAGYNAGVFTVAGSGSGIGAAGTGDEFRYVYQAASGDSTIVARVASVQNTSANAKACVMIRETNADNSAQAMCSVANGSVSFVRRTGTGGSSTTTSVSGINPAYWVRLQRVGDVFTASSSPDGTIWTTVGTATIAMTGNVILGLGVTSQADGTLTTATIDNVTATP